MSKSSLTSERGRIAVIGGGLGGLLAARALEAAGALVTIFEGEEVLGGVVQTEATGGWIHERAASSFLAKPGGMLALCRELGVPVVKAQAQARRRWIYIDGKRRQVPSGPLSLLTSDLLTLRGKLDLFAEPFRPARDIAQAGDESVYDFAARRLGAQMARALISPFVGGIFAADAHDISLEAGFPQLAELDAHGGLVRGQLGKLAARLLGKRGAANVASPETAAGSAAPAKLGKGDRGLWAPEGGMHAVISVLGAALGRSERVEVRLGCRVRELRPGEGFVEVVSEAAGATSEQKTEPKIEKKLERFTGVVAALPATAVARLVPSLAEAANRLGEIERAPAAAVSLGYRRADFTAPLDGFGMLVAAGEKARVLGVVFESVLWPGRAPADHVLLRCIMGGARDPSAVALADDELVAIASADLAHTLGITAAPVHAFVSKWAHGIAPFRVGHRQRVLEASTLLRAHRIALAGADYRGVGLNGICLDTPTVAAEALAWR
jgi:protoporphyrinogen/coproporphyrinogen III oxidase